MTPLRYVTKLIYLEANFDKIADPENVAFIEQKLKEIEGTDTIVISIEDMDKVSMIYNKVNKW